MTNFEVDECLNSMMILVDTREQPSTRSERRYALFDCPHERRKLEYGDYAYNFQLPGGRWLYEDDVVVNPDVVIERKMSLEELSQCFCQGRDRFEREFNRAREHGARIYLLIEDANFEKLYAGHYKTKFNPTAYKASLWAWAARYGMTPVMCKAEISGRIIKDILYRELKERLERGFYDEA